MLFIYSNIAILLQKCNHLYKNNKMIIDGNIIRIKNFFRINFVSLLSDFVYLLLNPIN